MASRTTYTTTLTHACGKNDGLIQVASADGINNPGSVSSGNSTATIIQIDNEYMEVDSNYKFGSLIVPVVRGTNDGPQGYGTDPAPHAVGATVTITAENNLQLNT